MGAQNQVETHLLANGFELVRHRKHKIFRRDDGKVFTMASTPSDWRSERNALTQLARLLGVQRRDLVYVPRVTSERSERINLSVNATVESVAPEPVPNASGLSDPVPVPASAEPQIERRRLTKRERLAAKRANEKRNEDISKQARLDRRERRGEERGFEALLREDREQEIARRHPAEEKFVALYLLRINLSPIPESLTLGSSLYAFDRHVETVLGEYVDVSVATSQIDTGMKSLSCEHLLKWDGRRHVLKSVPTDRGFCFYWDGEWSAETYKDSGRRMFDIRQDWCDWVDFVFEDRMTLTSQCTL